jgi:hypothetical protein
VVDKAKRARALLAADALKWVIAGTTATIAGTAAINAYFNFNIQMIYPEDSHSVQQIKGRTDPGAQFSRDRIAAANKVWNGTPATPTTPAVSGKQAEIMQRAQDELNVANGGTDKSGNVLKHGGVSPHEVVDLGITAPDVTARILAARERRRAGIAPPVAVPVAPPPAPPPAVVPPATAPVAAAPAMAPPIVVLPASSPGEHIDQYIGSRTAVKEIPNGTGSIAAVYDDRRTIGTTGAWKTWRGIGSYLGFDLIPETDRRLLRIDIDASNTSIEPTAVLHTEGSNLTKPMDVVIRDRGKIYVRDPGNVLSPAFKGDARIEIRDANGKTIGNVSLAGALGNNERQRFFSNARAGVLN